MISLSVSPPFVTVTSKHFLFPDVACISTFINDTLIPDTLGSLIYYSSRRLRWSPPMTVQMMIFWDVTGHNIDVSEEGAASICVVEERLIFPGTIAKQPLKANCFLLSRVPLSFSLTSCSCICLYYFCFYIFPASFFPRSSFVLIKLVFRGRCYVYIHWLIAKDRPPPLPFVSLTSSCFPEPFALLSWRWR